MNPVHLYMSKIISVLRLRSIFVSFGMLVPLSYKLRIILGSVSAIDDLNEIVFSRFKQLMHPKYNKQKLFCSGI